ncbi:hypothetical protein BpHYR1_047688 [Brachionus plicatilis]|uniref:Uncharacterized protein n=1 Tax=Brachionus plicatilis TaxID=10195 RepID=A0A3M7T3G5_BRAPC|nr:hypothetical protein BpHYR1_047688 [Brachionus plicatilis]
MSFEITCGKFAFFRRHLACHRCHVIFWYTNYLVASIRLLIYQRFSWSHEYSLSQWIPAVKIVHDNSGNKCFSHSCRQHDHRIFVQALFHNTELI